MNITKEEFNMVMAFDRKPTQPKSGIQLYTDNGDGVYILSRKRTSKGADYVSTVQMSGMACGGTGRWESMAVVRGHQFDEIYSHSHEHADATHRLLVSTYLDSSVGLNPPFFDRPRMALMALVIVLGILSVLRMAHVL